MFILVFEDNSLGVVDEVTEETFDAADDGYVIIINNYIMKQYSQGEWKEIKKMD